MKCLMWPHMQKYSYNNCLKFNASERSWDLGLLLSSKIYIVPSTGKCMILDFLILDQEKNFGLELLQLLEAFWQDDPSDVHWLSCALKSHHIHISKNILLPFLGFQVSHHVNQQWHADDKWDKPEAHKKASVDQAPFAVRPILGYRGILFLVQSVLWRILCFGQLQNYHHSKEPCCNWPGLEYETEESLTGLTSLWPCFGSF